MNKQIVSTLAMFTILILLGWYIDSLAHDEITAATRLVVYAVACIVILVIFTGTIVVILLFLERLFIARARRKVVQRDADVLVVTAEENAQVYIRDLNKHAYWRNAHLDSRVGANKQQTEPTQIEITNYQLRLARSRPSAITQVMPQLISAPSQLDLLAKLDNVQRCLIVGASDSGKTTLLQHLTNRRSHTSKVIVIDPHGWPGKYPKNCIVIGTGRNYAEIERALDALIQLMTKRYDEIGKGLVAEMGHSRLTIIIDEWRAIVGNLGKTASEAIKALLTESRKAAFSVFVATHSDRAKPLGLEGEYDLKDGFAVVRLSIINGQRQATLDTGNGEQPVILPGPCVVCEQQIIESEDFINLEVEPTVAEAEILRLFSEGASYNEISRQVFGNIGGKQTQRIKEVIAKFDQN